MTEYMFDYIKLLGKFFLIKIFCWIECLIQSLTMLQQFRVSKFQKSEYNEKQKEKIWELYVIFSGFSSITLINRGIYMFPVNSYHGHFKVFELVN